MRVAVAVTTVWTDPSAVRPVDAPAVAGEPDLAAWTAALGVPERLDLHERVVTQAWRGEPVLVDTVREDWAKVVLPLQPSSLDPRGYPGWVPAAHVEPGDGRGFPAGDADPLAVAMRLLGVGYLWGGMSEHGVDCSGLVALAHRRCGLVIPRDAHDQAAAGRPVDVPAAGDLVFFAANGRVHHVGMAVGDGTMLHAPRTGASVEVRSLADRPYRDELSVVRRFRDTAP